MKKILSFFTAFLPLIYVAAVFLLFLVDSTDELLLAVMIIYIAVALLLHALFLYHAAKAPPRFLAISNLCLYSGNFLLLLVEIIYWLVYYHQTQIAAQNGAMGGGLGLFLLILLYLPHWATYLLTHIVGASCCRITLKGKYSQGTQICHIIMQLLPITDLTSAIWVLLQLNKQEKIA